MTGVDFGELLRQHMGLNVDSIGSQGVARAVQERQNACNMADALAYFQHLQSDEAELQELVEAIIVPETWFFRDSEAFSALSREVSQHWLRVHPVRPLRLLSIPCSTGEEPYSLVMSLLDAGVPAQRFAVDAVDISQHSLRKARRAVYGKNSFRGGELSFRDRYFQRTASGDALSEQVKSKVTFRHGNFLGQDLLPGSEAYDAIFCRNVLIYFEAAAQERALLVLTKLLRGDGLLFVGPSETGLVSRGTFVSSGIPLAFAFRKAPAPASRPERAWSAPSSAAKQTRAGALDDTARSATSAGAKTARTAQAAASTSGAVANAAASSGLAAGGLELAAQLADQGRLSEAAGVCAEHLCKNGPSARAFHLLGLLNEAEGKLEAAVEHHKKALYLEPNHHEALLHLALLLQKQGDAAGAERLRTRASRLARKERA